LLQLALGHDAARAALVVGIGNARALVLESRLVDHRGIALGDVGLRQPRRLARELFEAEAGTDEIEHAIDAVERDAVRLPLLRRRTVAAGKRARDADHIAR